MELLRALTRPGDVVAISPPVYPPFFDWTPEAGARLLEVPLDLRTAEGWRLDLAALEAAFATHPAAYVLCNPHNPVGRVHSAGELAALVRLARQLPRPAGQRRDPRAAGAARRRVHPAARPFPARPRWRSVWSPPARRSTWPASNAPPWSPPRRRWPRSSARFPPDARWRTGHLGVIATVAAFRDGGRLAGPAARHAGRPPHPARRPAAPTVCRMLPWHPPEATYLAWLDCPRLGRGQRAPRSLPEPRQGGA